MRYTPKSELNARAEKLQRKLGADNLDGALIAQNVDLFYFAGTIQQSQLYIPREGVPILMTRRSFPRARRIGFGTRRAARFAARDAAHFAGT